MRVGSLFSGIGGIELGLERAGGFETVWFVEKEKYAQSILRQHWPEAEIYEDVTKVDFRSVPGVDIVTGGFPCQDISNAGKRAGIEGSRSSLWAYCVEALRILRPRIGLFENVSALTQRGLDKVLLDLSEVGYDAEWYCFPASSVGAHHRRDRIIIMAYSNDSRCLDGQTQEQSAERRQYAQRKLISSSSNVANSNCRRWNAWSECQYNNFQEWQIYPHKSENWGAFWSVTWTSNCLNYKDVAYSYSRYVQTHWSQRSCNCSNSSRQHSKSCGKRKSSTMDRGWWAFEPRVGRVANGVSNRSHRIKALGNAVVPAWAEAIGKAIKGEFQ